MTEAHIQIDDDVILDGEGELTLANTTMTANAAEEGVAPDELKLEPLADNGGFTESHALAPGSAAIDAMLAEDCSLSLPEPLLDQRDVNRPVGPACDIGSVEVE